MLNKLASVVGLLLFVCIGSAPLLAQNWLRTLPGVWTTGEPSACRSKFATVAVSGNQLQFRDQAGRLSIETILDRRADGLVTETARSFAVPAGTRWDYSIVSGGELRDA
jgi:hypothetical protein